MRKSNSIALATVFFLTVLSTNLFAQEAETEEPLNYVIMVKHHVNMDAFNNGGSSAEMDSLHQMLTDAYAENPLVVSYTTLRHAWGNDNSEVIDLIEVASWDAIDKFGAKNNEILVKKYGEDVLKKAGPEYQKYFTGLHQDEIYVVHSKAVKKN